jgi:hypothetical protein
VDDPNKPQNQVYRLPDGQRVIVVSQEGSPARALVRRIDGPRVDTHAIRLVIGGKMLETMR